MKLKDLLVYFKHLQNITLTDEKDNILLETFIKDNDSSQFEPYVEKEIITIESYYIKFDDDIEDAIEVKIKY